MAAVVKELRRELCGDIVKIPPLNIFQNMHLSEGYHIRSQVVFCCYGHEWNKVSSNSAERYL